jgi:hypothetical protein
MLRGKNIAISGIGVIKRNQTVTEYRARTGQVQEQSILAVQGISFALDYLV